MQTENSKIALHRKNPLAIWQNAKERLSPLAWPLIEPTFTFSAEAIVYTIGSCFARNIEEHLDLLGCTIPTLAFAVPRDEWKGLRENGILNKYTPSSIYQDLSWVAGIYTRNGGFQPEDADIFRFDVSNGKVIDLQLAGFTPVSVERFYERRKQIYHMTASAFTADCVTMTLGLIETWMHKGMYVQQPPASRELLKFANDFQFVVLDYETSYKMIHNSVSLLQKLNPEVKVLITTSPVPMERTFTTDDVIIANMTSKSTLRTVAKKIAEAFEGVDYFPSYEAVVMSPLVATFDEDFIHVKDEFVGKIVSTLIANYFPETSELAKIIQACAAQLGAPNPSVEAFEALRWADPQLDSLSLSQLTIFLRVAWRLRDRNLAREISEAILVQNARPHTTLRAIAHIWPRLGMQAEARLFASDVLAKDPSNSLAQSLME